MIFVVYAETSGRNLDSRLGKPDYSYHFVLESFRPMLEKLGIVVDVGDTRDDTDRGMLADAIYDLATSLGQQCVFLSFTPPHRTPVGLRCPTICVFAWEYYDLSTIENGTDRAEWDWSHVLGSLGRAITHSRHSANVVREALGADFPIAVIPSPVWDGFARPAGEPCPCAWVDGVDIDFEGDLFEAPSPAPPDGAIATKAAAEAVFELDLGARFGGSPVRSTRSRRLRLEGVVYTTVFNPNDDRKNWLEIVRCFCLALRDRADATLVLKVVHSGPAARVRKRLRRELDRLEPFACRVVVVDAHLDGRTYRDLLSSSTYCVNASRGEGQCIPLMEAMAAGRPALAPPHTALADYVDATNAFLVDSSLEPAGFPHVVRSPYGTWRHRVSARSLFDAFRESYRVAREDPERYAAMSRSATDSVRRHASLEISEAALHELLARPPRPTRRSPIVRDTRAEIRRRAHRTIDQLDCEPEIAGRAAAEPRVGALAGVDLHFVLAGFGKCGTTTLSALLGAHPEVFIPVEELWYFGVDPRSRHPGAFADFFARAQPEREKLGYCSVTSTSVNAEIRVRRELLAHYPEAKIVLIARDPIDRVEASFREYHHSWTRFGIPPPPFDVGAALRAIPELVPDACYASRVANYADHVAPEQLHVVFFEELLRDPVETMRGLFAFLEVDPEAALPDVVPRLNPGEAKYRDTHELRAMRDPNAFPDVAGAASVLPPELGDRIFVPLGQRRRFDRELPGWDEATQRWFVEQIEKDVWAFLDSEGRSDQVWPRFAALARPRMQARRGILATECKRYSQRNEELIIRDFFQDRRGGFFLDVGCAWPVRISTTYYLEKHLGWSGIAVDAVIEEPEGWKRKRPNSRLMNFLVGRRSCGVARFYCVPSTGLSSTQRKRVVSNRTVEGSEIEVPTISLTDLLERNGVETIDFLSMDIEESEPEALAGFDIERFRPQLVCVEAGRNTRAQVREYFAAHGYVLLEKYREHDRVNWYFAPRS